MSGPQPLPNANDGIITIEPTIGSAIKPSLGPWSVHTVLSTLPTPPPTTPLPTPFPFLHLLTRLKTTPREGWRRFDIHNGESISDHMYRMSIMTMLAPPALTSRLNIPHCTKMALVHDMAESLVGDITPKDVPPVSDEEKHRREAETMEYLCGTLLGNYAGGTQAKGLLEIFEEYEEGTTSESIFVHDVDKVELLLQMVEYEREAKGEIDLCEFIGVTKKIKLEAMKEWAREILNERRGYWRGLGKVPQQIDAADKI